MKLVSKIVLAFTMMDGKPTIEDDEYVYTDTELHPSSDNIISYTPLSEVVL